MTALLVVALLQAATLGPIPGTLDDVAFMAGHWVEEDGGSLSEEVWTLPSGDSMLGMWRYLADGRVQIFEILTLKAEEGGVTLRLRHFDPKLVGREDKETPVELRLVAKKPREAVFEGLSGAGRVRLAYTSPEEGALVGVLEKGGEPQRFAFRRRGAAGH